MKLNFTTETHLPTLPTGRQAAGREGTEISEFFNLPGGPVN
jgi:hypothetical protein